MSHSDDEILLIRLGNASPEPLRRLVGLRGHTVIGSGGKLIGKVIDFYIDFVDLLPRFLQAVVRGTGVQKAIILIPMTAIAVVSGDTIYLNESRESVVSRLKIANDVAQQRYLPVQDDRLIRGISAKEFPDDKTEHVS